MKCLGLGYVGLALIATPSFAVEMKPHFFFGVELSTEFNTEAVNVDAIDADRAWGLNIETTLGLQWGRKATPWRLMAQLPFTADLSAGASEDRRAGFKNAPLILSIPSLEVFSTLNFQLTTSWVFPTATLKATEDSFISAWVVKPALSYQILDRSQSKESPPPFDLAVYLAPSATLALFEYQTASDGEANVQWALGETLGALLLAPEKVSFELSLTPRQLWTTQGVFRGVVSSEQKIEWEFAQSGSRSSRVSLTHSIGSSWLAPNGSEYQMKAYDPRQSVFTLAFMFQF